MTQPILAIPVAGTDKNMNKKFSCSFNLSNLRNKIPAVYKVNLEDAGPGGVTPDVF